ncbi:MAG: proton-conducting transporter membrane subunit, partial [Pseudomonadota bacterium]
MIEAIAALVPAALAAHAPALLIVVPMLAAPLAGFMPNGRLAWFLTILASGFALLMAIVLLAQVQSVEGGAVISYAMGGWLPPHGIELRIDSLNAMVILLVAAIGFLCAIFGWPSIVAEIPSAKRAMFFGAYLVCLMGLLGIAATGDAFNLFVFLELSSLSTYVLVALGSSRDRRALPAASHYLILGTIGASFFVVGVGFLYAATGTLNMADLGVRLQGLESNKAVLAGYAFIFVGLGIKAAMFPLHQWL